MPFPKKTTPVKAAATNRHRRHPLRRQDEDDVQQQQAQPFILLPCDEEHRGLLDVLMANPTCAAASQDGQKLALVPGTQGIPNTCGSSLEPGRNHDTMDKAVELLHQRFLHGGAVSGSSQHCFDMIVTLDELLGSLFVPDRIVLYLGNSKLKTVPPLFVEKSIHLALCQNSRT